MAETGTANRIFINTIGDAIYGADQLRDRDRVEYLASLLRKVQAREINKVCGSVNADEITFTDEQWVKIEGRISMALGSARAESDDDT
jgi:hypothetical protein